MTKSNHHSLSVTLTTIGAIVAIIGYVMQILGLDVWGIVRGIGGIIISILILSSVGKARTKATIPFTWWMLLIWIILQVILVGVGSILSVVGIGVLLELIACIILLVDEL